MREKLRNGRRGRKQVHDIFLFLELTGARKSKVFPMFANIASVSFPTLQLLASSALAYLIYGYRDERHTQCLKKKHLFLKICKRLVLFCAQIRIKVTAPGDMDLNAHATVRCVANVGAIEAHVQTTSARRR